MEQLEAASDRVGLYSLGGVVLMESIGGEESERPSITMAFQIGERAYAKAVQDPEGVAMDAEFEAVAGDLATDHALDALVRLAEDLDD